MSDHLATLHTALVDAREGYRKAIEKADEPNLLSILRSVDGLHAAAHEDVHRLLAAQGERPDDEGSLMGTVHKAVVAVRSAVVGLDHGSLDAFASGEERNIETYDEAIGSETDERSREILERHRDALHLKIAEMKSQAARP
jgi:uncharacterized protein (TIGR02284 family)